MTPTTETTPRWMVLEFTQQGAKCVHDSTDFEAARAAYDALESATWLEAHGRDQNGEPIPGIMTHNIFLGRKFHGIDQEIA